MLYNVYLETVWQETFFGEVKNLPNRGEITKKMCVLTNAIRKYCSKSPTRHEVEDMTGTNGWVIAYLYENSDREVYQRDLEHEFGISRSTTSKMLARMEEGGLVRRVRVFVDDRLKKIVLTDKSKMIAEKIREDNLKTEQKLMQGFSAEEIRTFENYLQRMLINISE